MCKQSDADVFIDEVCTEDPEQFVLDKFKGKEVTCEKVFFRMEVLYLI